jgi:hypothetical protein
MNKKTLFLLASFLVMPLYAGEDVDLTKSASADGLVKIDSVRGEVIILGWDKDEISVVGELDDLAKELIFEVHGDRSLIKVVMPHGGINWGDGSDLEIRVPKGSRVDFVGVSADTVAEDIIGGVRIRSVSGDIETKNIRGHLMLSSVSGDIKIDDCEGALHSSTVSGNVDILSHMGQIDLETVSGSIEIETLENEKMRVKSISGEIDVVSDLLSGAFVDIQSISGEIELELTGDVGAEFEIDAGMSGGIDNELSDDEVFRSRNGRESLKMKIGDGSGRVRIKTLSADIKLE